MGLKQNVGNNIQGSFPDLWSAMNDLEQDLDQNKFGIKYLNNVIDNLNITDIQQKITNVESTVKFLINNIQQKIVYWKQLGKIGCHLYKPKGMP